MAQSQGFVAAQRSGNKKEQCVPRLETKKKLENKYEEAAAALGAPALLPLPARPRRGCLGGESRCCSWKKAQRGSKCLSEGTHRQSGAGGYKDARERAGCNSARSPEQPFVTGFACCFVSLWRLKYDGFAAAAAAVWLVLPLPPRQCAPAATADAAACSLPSRGSPA